MTKTQKHLSFMALASLVFCGAAVFGASTNISKNMMESIKADNSGSYSVSFNRTICGGSDYNTNNFTKESSLQQSGIAVYAHAVNAIVTSGTDFARFSANSSAYIEFYIDSTANIGFQEITGFSFAYNATYAFGNFDIYYSTDGSTYPSSPNAEVRDALASVSLPGYGVKKIKFAGLDDKYAYFNTITINYSCGEPVEKALSSISLSGQTTEYNVGDSFSFDGTCTAHYTDGSSSTVTPTTVSSPDMSSSGVKTVTVTYTEDEITKTETYDITVEEAAPGLTGTYTGTYTSIEFTSSTTGTYIYGNERLYFTYVLSGSTITFTYLSGDNTSFGSYRLFAGGSSPKVNSTGSVTSGTQISVKTYNLFDSATNRTFTKS